MICQIHGCVSEFNFQINTKIETLKNKAHWPINYLLEDFSFLLIASITKYSVFRQNDFGCREMENNPVINQVQFFLKWSSTPFDVAKRSQTRNSYMCVCACVWMCVHLHGWLHWASYSRLCLLSATFYFQWPAQIIHCWFWAKHTDSVSGVGLTVGVPVLQR